MDKKDTSEKTTTISKIFHPHQVEARIYESWKQQGLFAPSASSTGHSFSMVLPPANVTGPVHLGYAARISTQDSLVRYHRKKGDSTLWVPGTDHAGLSTYVSLEKKILEQGKKIRDLSSEQFLKRAWDWTHSHQKHIKEQEESMGASLDWSKERFTLDEKSVKATQKAFIDLYNKGLITREEQVIHWCPKCATSLSELEVEHRKEIVKLYLVRYFLKAADKSIMVATTRPETMLGDTAIAIHPQDKRYKEFMDKTLILPILNKEVPVITDTRVDMDAGTGAIKIAPAHDRGDYIIAKDHDLAPVVVIGLDGKMNKNAGKFAGLDVVQARQNIIEYLDNIGNLEDIEECESTTLACGKCGTPVEQMISTQWFVKTAEMKKKAQDLVTKKTTTITPTSFQEEYLNWIEAEQDWCISRQIPWGTSMPVYYNEQGEMLVQEKAPAGEGWTQEKDVLDTWFTASLWPAIALGWPEKTPEFKEHYPTSVLETGKDTFFLWVCRMMLILPEVTGKTPFSHVVISGLVRDEEHQKMSRTKGNGLEPKLFQEKYGTDALRMMLTMDSIPGKDFSISETRIEYYRNFLAKFWNAARYISLQEDLTSLAYNDSIAYLEQHYGDFQDAEKWILSRLQYFIEKLTTDFEKYDPSTSYNELCHFTWHEFSDWFLEISKVDTSTHTRHLLHFGLITLLHLWHPMIPFITEELWSNFHKETTPLMVASWPTGKSTFRNEEIEHDFSLLLQVVSALRTMREERNVAPGLLISVHIVAEEKDYVLERFTNTICKLGRLRSMEIHKGRPLLGKKAVLVVQPFEIHIPLEDLVDIEKEKIRLNLCIANCEKHIRMLGEKIANEAFMANAPADIIQDQLDKIEGYKNQLEHFIQQREELY